MFDTRNVRAWFLLVCLSCLAALAVASSEAGAIEAAEGRKTGDQWTVDDLLLAESARDFRVSPDGKRAVWVKRRMHKGKGSMVSNLFLSSLTDDDEIQLTRAAATCSRPRWSPDGRSIAFLGTRPLPEKFGDETGGGPAAPAKRQLWVIRPLGGEPWPVTETTRGVMAFEWKDARTIVFTAQEERSLYQQQIKKRKDTSRVVDDERHEPPVRLYTLDVAAKTITRTSTNDDRIQDLAISPDGRWAVTVHARSLHFAFDQQVPPALFLTDLETGDTKRIASDKRLVPVQVAWAADAGGFYFSTLHSSDPFYLTATDTVLYYHDRSRGRTEPVDLGWSRGLAEMRNNLQVTRDGFIALLADGVRYRPARYRKTQGGWRMTALSGVHQDNIFAWTLGSDGRTLLYNHSTASLPAQWYRAKLSGHSIRDQVPLTHLNPAFDDKPISRSEIVTWAGARDEQVDGVLHYPTPYEPGKRYPLILMIHGGPTGVDRDSWTLGWSRPITPFTQRGAFVLRVNYHGSGNHGLSWAESICCGNYYDLERIDLEAGVDAMIARGLADPEKLGTIGWSNGAILSTELITRSRRYKAASTGAGDVEWISDWANVDFGASFDNYYFGKAPYEDPQLYIRKSPYFRLKDVTTPTIIYTGTEDRNVPPSQSWSHFRVMQQATSTPVKFILFPGEPHGPRRYVHQRRKVEEDLAWFDRYLFATHEEPNEALKEGSPLDVALRTKGIGRVDGLYGVQVHGRLVPEVVEHAGLMIGRFEVTRAQYAAFDGGYRYAAGTGDYPASGLGYRQAEGYVTWLSRVTGATYRLPLAREVAPLYDSARGGENTLDYWAGYAPNPDDARRLASQIARLKGDAPLLRPVGAFKGRGDRELVFDLGGNVAEWCVDADGNGVLLGGSADRPADRAAHGSSPGKAYRGLRVMRGPAPGGEPSPE